jgi:hypothetical protein
LTPIPASEDVSSLSAILLDQDADRFIREIASVEIDFRSMGLGALSMTEALTDFRMIYL